MLERGRSRIILDCYVELRGYMRKCQYGILKKTATKQEMGYSLYIKTPYPQSFSINEDDIKYALASKGEYRCKYVFFESSESGIKFAVEIEWVGELLKGKDPRSGTDGSGFYVLEEYELKGESFPYEDLPF